MLWKRHDWWQAWLLLWMISTEALTSIGFTHSEYVTPAPLSFSGIAMCCSYCSSFYGQKNYWTWLWGPSLQRGRYESSFSPHNIIEHLIPHYFYSTTWTIYIVFEGLVRSGFYVPKQATGNRNWSIKYWTGPRKKVFFFLSQPVY